MKTRTLIFLAIIVILVMGAIMIWNQSTNVKDTVSRGTYPDPILIFNKKFEGYEGEKTGEAINALVTTVISNNSETANLGKVSIEFEGFDELKTPRIKNNKLENASAIKSDKDYIVSIEYENKEVDYWGEIEKGNIVSKIIVKVKEDS